MTMHNLDNNIIAATHEKMHIGKSARVGDFVLLELGWFRVKATNGAMMLFDVATAFESSMKNVHIAWTHITKVIEVVHVSANHKKKLKLNEGLKWLHSLGTNAKLAASNSGEWSCWWDD